MLRRHTRPGLLHRGSRGPKTPSTYGNETWTARAWEKVNTKKKKCECNANAMPPNFPESDSVPSLSASRANFFSCESSG